MRHRAASFPLQLGNSKSSFLILLSRFAVSEYSVNRGLLWGNVVIWCRKMPLSSGTIFEITLKSALEFLVLLY
jgi:hypothetical protein